MLKTVLITGASKGIGLATSLRLAQAGYEVIGIARTVVKDYPGTLFQCDLSDRKATTHTLDEIRKNFKFDAIVNNVGVVMPEALGEICFDSLHQVYDLSVRVAVSSRKNTGAPINVLKNSISIFRFYGL